MTAPRIEFHVVKNRQEFNRTRSSNQVIKFRVWRRRARVEFDSDWFSTELELTLSAYIPIRNAWEADVRKFPIKGSFGGERACLAFEVAPEREQFFRGFLADTLGSSNAWVSLRRAA